MDELINYLSGFVTPRRVARFEEVLEFRTRYLTVVLEDIYQSQNASAVVRSCDCFGIQDLHIIENENKFVMDREVALGAEKWLTLHHYRSEKVNNSLAAIHRLRKNNYRIVATCPNTGDTSLPDYDLNRGPAAIFFGTELTGISETVRHHADEFIRIPMFGFTESFNISVSVALVLQNLVGRLHPSPVNWKLALPERKKIKLDWLRKSIKNIGAVEERFPG